MHFKFLSKNVAIRSQLCSVATFMQSRIRVALMSQCDVAIRSQLCSTATFIYDVISNHEQKVECK